MKRISRLMSEPGFQILSIAGGFLLFSWPVLTGRATLVSPLAWLHLVLAWVLIVGLLRVSGAMCRDDSADAGASRCAEGGSGERGGDGPDV